tara:strand:- start:432 stop:845 length:414 start_codon:yes stop_codon:yes gene_type:complete
VIVELVPLNTVHIVWRHVEDYLKATLEKSAGEFNIDHVKAHVVAGLQSLYIALDKDTNKIAGAATVNFINYPNYRLAYVTAMGGKMITNEDNWKKLALLLKQAGATRCHASASDSATRLYESKVGFKKIYNTVERIL